jgi:hypothetical protein
MDDIKHVTQVHLYFKDGSCDGAPLIGVRVSYDIINCGNGIYRYQLTEHEFLHHITPEQEKSFFDQYHQNLLLQQQMLQQQEAAV